MSAARTTTPPNPARRSMPKTPLLEFDHPVMTCPVCQTAIVARIQAVTVIEDPVLSGEQVVAQLSTAMVRFDVDHPCSGPAKDAAPAGES